MALSRMHEGRKFLTMILIIHRLLFMDCASRKLFHVKITRNWFANFVQFDRGWQRMRRIL